MGRRVVSTRRMAARVSWAQGRNFNGRHFTAEVILWAVRWYLMSRSVLSGLAPPPLADKGWVGYRGSLTFRGGADGAQSALDLFGTVSAVWARRRPNPWIRAAPSNPNSPNVTEVYSSPRRGGTTTDLPLAVPS